MNGDFLFRIFDSFLLILIPAFIFFGTKIISFPVNMANDISNKIGIIRIAKHRMEKDDNKKAFSFYVKEVKADIDEEEELLFKA